MIVGGGLMTNTFPDGRGLMLVYVTYKAVAVVWLAITIYFLHYHLLCRVHPIPCPTYLAVLSLLTSLREIH